MLPDTPSSGGQDRLRRPPSAGQRHLENRRTRPHPSRRDHARNHGGSEDEDFRHPLASEITAPKIRGVSIAVESKQLQVISSPTRNRAAMVAFSVPLCRRGRASAALI